MRIIYVDNNATTPIAKEVVDAMMPYLTNEYFNPSSMYEQARHTANAIARARQTIASMFNLSEPDEILFTSCATESNNMAIMGAIRANSARKHVITSSVEHPAVLEVCRQLQRMDFDVTFLPKISLASFAVAISLPRAGAKCIHCHYCSV